MMNGYRALLVWIMRVLGALMMIGGTAGAAAMLSQLASHPSADALENFAPFAGALSLLSVTVGGISSLAIAEVLALSMKRIAGNGIAQ